MNSDMRVWVYRHYVANSLRLIPENKYLTKTLSEVLSASSEDEMTGDDILEDLLDRGIIRFKE